MRPPWLLLLASTLLLSSQHTSTYAQTPPPTAFTPTPVYYSQSVFIPHQKLFIHGGTTNEGAQPISQTFYIDLSQKWPASKPIYGKLVDGTAAMGTTTTLSNSFWYSFYQSSAFKININSGAWESLPPPKDLGTRDDLPAVTDPAANQIYILNGYAVGNVIQGTIRFDTTTILSSNGSQLAPRLGGFTTTWSTVTKGAIVFGGYNLDGFGVPVTEKTMYNYIPIGDITNKIFNASDSGESPAARFDHCMVEAYNGTKMILFGGYEKPGRFLNDIYILDVATLKWTKGTPGGPTVARRRASCAVTNDYFVVWGGAVPDPISSTMTALSQNVTLVYNLVTNQWVDEYSPDPYVPPPPAVTAVTPPSGTGTENGSNPTGTGTGIDTGSNGNSSLDGSLE
ncbi:hypothetical protein BGW39_001013, partial [Mortierella sp. 14UC]